MEQEREVAVPARRPDEDVVQWMNLCVQPALYLEHRRLQPVCRRTELEYAKITLEGDKPIGAQPTLQ